METRAPKRRNVLAKSEEEDGRKKKRRSTPNLGDEKPEKKYTDFFTVSLVAQILFGQNLKYFLEEEVKKGYIVNKVDWSFLRECRLVCKAWRRWIDDALEIHSTHKALRSSETSLYNCSLTFPKTQLPPWSVINCKITAVQNRLKQAMTIRETNSNYNPFPSRHLKVQYFDQSPGFKGLHIWPSFSKLVTSVLEVFGSEIRYLTLNIDQCALDWKQYTNFLAAHQSVAKWLHLLPNLKSLVITVPWVGHKVPKFNSAADAAIRNIQIPTLKNLEMFQCDAEKYRTFSFAPVILKANPHIKKLLFYACEYTTEMLDMELPNLKELAVHCAISQQTKINLVKWKPEKLSIVFGKRPEKRSRVMVSLDSRTAPIISNVISHFKNRLRHLDLQLMGPILSQFQWTDFPQLQHLNLVVGNWTRIDWGVALEELKQLVVLRVWMHSLGRPTPSMEEISDRNAFCHYVETLHSGRYWSNFPKLVAVELNVRYRQERCRTSYKESRHTYNLERLELPTLEFSIAKIGWNQFQQKKKKSSGGN